MEIYSNEHLNPYRYKKDPVADKVINNYFSKSKELLQQHLDELIHNRSSLPKDADADLKQLFDDLKKTTEGFDQEELEKGQDFFDSNASDIMLLLGFMSLPYCYAAASGAEVLIRSKKILEEPEVRLTETAEFVFDVTKHGAFGPEGKAIVSILKVRLQHAASRWYIQESGDWDTETFGEPLNQEDMAGTNLAFSLITVRGLRKLGRFLEPERAFRYIGYWNKIGLLLGVDPDLIPDDNRKAFNLEKSIRARHFKISDPGVKLADALYNYYEKATLDTPLEGFTKTFMIYLLGDKIARQVGLKIDNYDRLVFKPYELFIKYRTFFFESQDSYANAYARFKEKKS